MNSSTNWGLVVKWNIKSNKKNRILLHTTAWMNLIDMMLSEKRHIRAPSYDYIYMKFKILNLLWLQVCSGVIPGWGTDWWETWGACWGCLKCSMSWSCCWLHRSIHPYVKIPQAIHMRFVSFPVDISQSERKSPWWWTLIRHNQNGKLLLKLMIP